MSLSLSSIGTLSRVFVSMISRTKYATSSAPAVLLSPRKSMRRWMTLAATSGNLTAQLCTACNTHIHTHTGHGSVCVCLCVPRRSHCQHPKPEPGARHGFDALALCFAGVCVCVCVWGTLPDLTCTSICLYSPLFSKSLFCVFMISFFRTITTYA